MIRLLDSYRRFRRTVNLLAVKEFKPLGLGTKQASLLRHLGELGQCSHADLARLTSTDPAATGRILDELIRRGLVSRAEHPTDRRRWVLSLSPEGRALAVKIQACFVNMAGEMAAPLESALRAGQIGPAFEQAFRRPHHTPSRKRRMTTPTPGALEILERAEAADEGLAPATGWRKAFTALRNPNYRYFYSGQTLSLIGTWTRTAALGWVAFQFTHSAFLLGLVFMLNALPILLFATYSGSLADSVPKIRIFTVTSWFSLLSSLALAVMLFCGPVHIAYLMVFAFLWGSSTAFEMPASNT